MEASMSYMVAAKSSKRAKALATVFYDVARNGKHGRASVRARVEGGIGYDAWMKAGRDGMAHRASCANATCPCKLPAEDT